MTLKFSDPPARRGGPSGRHTDFAAELRKFPNRWALADESVTNSSAANTVHRFKRGMYGPGFEACSRTNPDGTASVYVRFVGVPSKRKE